VRRHSAGGNGGGWSAGDPGLPPESYIGLAELKLTYDPMRDARERGGAKGAARRAALQAMRPYTHHQDELNRSLVGALQEANERIEDILLETQRLQIQLRKISGAMGDSDLQLLLEGLRARPASTHPAISRMDEHGRRVLGFDGASSDAATYRGFEDIFRGDERVVREQQAAYVELFADAGAQSVLDLGCGRGEFLDALVARGIDARGADMDESMVARCLEKGHDVTLADAATYLRALDDGSVPGMFAAQVVEHLDAKQLSELLALMQRKLAPGGLAIMETVNPHNPAALKAFWTDTTHHHPLFPEVLLAFCRLSGFDSGEVRFPAQTGNFDADVYSNRDYAVVVRAAPA
jgi:SAM-dependent methyltransferase